MCCRFSGAQIGHGLRDECDGVDGEDNGRRRLQTQVRAKESVPEVSANNNRR